MVKKVLKTAFQITIICLIYFAGNLISSLISDFIVIPGNIVGMIILLILLSTNTMKLSLIEETGNFMLKYMGFFFVPLIAGIMDSYKLIEDSIFQVLIILTVSCILVMFISSKVTDYLISRQEGSTND